LAGGTGAPFFSLGNILGMMQADTAIFSLKLYGAAMLLLLLMVMAAHQAHVQRLEVPVGEWGHCLRLFGLPQILLAGTTHLPLLGELDLLKTLLSLLAVLRFGLGGRFRYGLVAVEEARIFNRSE